jgi:poly-gamma-glutamate capsule biosynthesis protein CapA/YwtB (metallophosphatase superfamily)
VGTRRVGLFAMAYGTNRRAATRDVHLRFDGVPYRISRAKVEALTARLRDRGATHVVGILHWGYEHEREPAVEQRACADVLFEAGVSAVVGHHPHVVQRSECRDGHWVSYSLGDFVGGDRTIWSRFGALVALRFEEGGAVQGELVPIVQSPFWQRQRTMLLDEAPRLERAVFERYFAGRL